MGSAIAATGFGWSESVPLLAGDNGTAQTIGLIRRAREQALRDPAVRAIAGRIVAGIPPNNLAGQCKAIYEWVKRNIAFVRDPVGHETVSSPRWTLQAGFGDCDDLALLIASMVGVVGIESRLVTVALQPNAPESFSHIYAEAFIGHNWGGTRASAEERWVTMDTARSNARFDREPSLYYRKRIWYFDPPAHQDVPGLSGMAD